MMAQSIAVVLVELNYLSMQRLAQIMQQLIFIVRVLHGLIAFKAVIAVEMRAGRLGR